jgi:hypothetical protein
MLLMARNTPGAPGFDLSDLDQTTSNGVTFLGWNSVHAAPPSAQFVAALAQLGATPPPTAPDAGAAAPGGLVPIESTGSAEAAVAAATAPYFTDDAAHAIDFAALVAILSTPDSASALQDSWLV